MASSRQVVENLRRTLVKLPVRQREILHLVFYQELSIQDAANVIDVSVGSKTMNKRDETRLKNTLRSCALRTGVLPRSF